MTFSVAVLVKQVPCFEELSLRPDGRLDRSGHDLELNPYCRRAVAKGVMLAREHGGTCIALTLGPPSAEDCLREAVAWGADHGILISDPVFAGSDTLATSKTLASALARAGPFDLVLAGRNSVDADTGQVAPQVAELLGLPFLSGVHDLELREGRLAAVCELDDSWLWAEVALPVVVSCAERLCEPAKVPSDQRILVPQEKIHRLGPSALGPGPWGIKASRTMVGTVHAIAADRSRLLFDGPVESQVRQVVAAMADLGIQPAVPQHPSAPAIRSFPGIRPLSRHKAGNTGRIGNWDGTRSGIEKRSESGVVEGPAVSDGWILPRQKILVLAEPGRLGVTRELLGAAAGLASHIGAVVRVIAVEGTDPSYEADPAELARWGADELLLLEGIRVEEDVAHAVARFYIQELPWAILAPSTSWGREIASRVAARLEAGLTGDAVDLDVVDGRLVAWKPAFGGLVLAAITATSETQMVTVRPGVLPLLAERQALPATVAQMTGIRGSRVEHTKAVREDDIGELAAARVVIGVGVGVAPEDYPLLDPLVGTLGAAMAATRKVTDRHWLPRSRQVGITGRSISPSLYVAVGVSGKFNHMIGVRTAGVVLAINSDRSAPVFDAADLGIVGDWHQVVPLLVREFAR